MGDIPYVIKGNGKYDCEIEYRPDDLKIKMSKGII